jgi:hypothetical protein
MSYEAECQEKLHSCFYFAMTRKHVLYHECRQVIGHTVSVLRVYGNLVPLCKVGCRSEGRWPFLALRGDVAGVINVKTFFL